MNNIKTMINTRGREVVCKENTNFPIQYANDTQALAKIEKLGEGWEILRPSMFARGLQIAKKLN